MTSKDCIAILLLLSLGISQILGDDFSTRYQDKDKIQIKDLSLHREKRVAVSTVIGIAGIVVSLLPEVVPFFTKDRDASPPDPPPKIKCFVTKTFLPPSQDLTYVEFTLEAEDYRMVTLEANTAPGGLKSISNRLWRSYFEVAKGAYTASFVARGRHYESRCSSVVYVIEINCGYPPRVLNGYPESLDKFSWGNKVLYQCNRGHYALNRITECQKNGDVGQWKPTPDDCKKSTCPKPLNPHGGVTICSEHTSYLDFGNVCQFKCKDGYNVKPNEKTTGYCKADGTWDTSVPECVDIQPPILTYCPDDIIEYLKPAEYDIKLTYDLPKYEDNSGDMEVVLLEGKPSGHSFQFGNHRMIYTAKDSADNIGNICSFNIDIRAIKCPRMYIEVYDSNLDEPDCTQDNLLGSLCRFSCKNNLTLVGSSSSICLNPNNGPMGTWTHLKKPPSCQVKECPELQKPRNGNLICGKWHFGKMCYPKCNDGHDFETKPPGLYTCSTTSSKPEWEPSSAIPNCLKKIAGNPSVEQEFILEFEGNCEDTETKELINSIFSGSLSSAVDQMPCPAGHSCEAHITESECLQNEKRRKRNVGGDFKVKFELTILTDDGSPVEAADDFVNHLDRMDEAIVAMATKNLLSFDVVKNTTLSIVEAAVKRTSPTIICAPGFFNSGANGCVPCGYGEFYSENDRACLLCPKGFYQPEQDQSSCIPCKFGFSTRKEGAITEMECEEMCDNGTVSMSGFKPCYPCDLGTFQNQTGQTECIQCPPGLLTEIEGAVNIQSCEAADIFLGGDGIHLTSQMTENLTLTLKVKINQTDTDKCSLLTLAKENNDNFLEMNIAENLTIISEREIIHHEYTFDPRSWVMLQISMSTEKSHFSVLIDEVMVVDEAIQIPKYEGKVRLKVMENCKGRMTNMNVWSTTRYPMNAGCYSSEQGDILSWDEILHNQNYSSLLRVPSKCRDYEPCRPNPCLNNGTCLESIDGTDFTCSCLQDFQGQSCEDRVPFCQDDTCLNDGICEEGDESFICTCAPGFTGLRCDMSIVDGQWGNWSEWSSCSHTCGEGTKTRARACNNPAPQNGGEDCIGKDSEIGTCILGECKSCSPIQKPENGNITCTELDGSLVCEIYCNKGYFFTREIPENYTCGPDTGHLWTDQEPNTEIFKTPKCSEFLIPRKLHFQYEIPFANMSCNTEENSAQSTAILEKTKDILNDVPCIVVKNCTFTATVTECDKENEVPKIHIQINAVISDGNSADIESIYKYVDLVKDLEKAGQILLEKSNDGGFDVEFNGTVFTVDTENIFYQGKYDCDGGMRKDNICVRCESGQYKEGNMCFPCPKGSYQPIRGQESCLPCPVGMTTVGIETSSQEDCITIDEVTTNPGTLEDMQTTNEDVQQVKGTSTGSINTPFIGGIIGAVLLVIAIVA